jgi:hypothetical protein
MDIKHLLPRAGPEAMDSGNGSQCRRHAAYCTATCLPAEAVTTHRDTFVPMCRQVFGLADMDLAIRLLVPASQSWTTSACGDVRFRFTAAGQFRNYTGFPFKPDRRSRLDGHRRTQHIGCAGQGQPNKLCTSLGISRTRQDAARAATGLVFSWLGLLRGRNKCGASGYADRIRAHRGQVRRCGCGSPAPAC